ncbi:hypothetical protein ACFSMW_05830 [Virgibacillus halophilus]
MRYFIILLLFVVFFLAGAVFGIDRNHPATDSNQMIDNDVLISEQNSNSDRNKDRQTYKVETADAARDIVDMEESPSMMQKTASLLGSGVQHIFEMLASILYQIAKAFF